MDQHGTRPLQKLLKKCQPLTMTRSAFLSECIRGDILELATNIHGNHVLQYCIENFRQEAHKDPIYTALIEHCPKVATDRQGCCVMQTCLKTGSANQQSRLIAKIVENVQVLISDQFANYVVSEVIHFGERNINVQIAKVVCANLGNYCCSKFSSSVVESLMKYSGPEVKEMIFEVFTARENY